MKRITIISVSLAVCLAQPVGAYQFGDTASAVHTYEKLLEARTGGYNGVDCYETGTELPVPDGISLDTNRTSGTIDFDSYQNGSTSITSVGGIDVTDGDGRYFGYISGEFTTTFWDNGPDYSIATSYYKDFKGLLITADEPQLRGVYYHEMDQDWIRNDGVAVEDSGHLKCHYNVEYTATLHNGNLPSETLLNLLYDIQDLYANTGLNEIVVGSSTNATLDATQTATAVPYNNAPDQYAVTYAGIELATDPGVGETTASFTISNFAMSDDDLLLLPVYFTGVLDEAGLSVSFNGTPLETIARLDVSGKIRIVGFDSEGVKGTAGPLQVTLTNTGVSAQPSTLLLVQEIQGLPERPAPSSGGGGGAGFGVLFLIMMGGFVRRH